MQTEEDGAKFCDLNKYTCTPDNNGYGRCGDKLPGCVWAQDSKKFEKTCHNCGNVTQFEKDVKQWKCVGCGATNPKMSFLMWIIGVIVCYLILRTIWIIMGLPVPI